MIEGLESEPVRLGKFKYGEKDENGNPRSLNYWKVAGIGAEAVMNLYGEQPREVPVYLPTPLGVGVWDGAYRRYSQNGLACTGNGLVGMQRQAQGPDKEIPCAQKGCPFAQPGINSRGRPEAAKCGPIYDLTFVVVGTESLGGTFRLSVRGLTTIREWNSFLKILQTESGGNLAGVPFLLAFSERPTRFGKRFYPVLKRAPRELGKTGVGQTAALVEEELEKDGEEVYVNEEEEYYPEDDMATKEQDSTTLQARLKMLLEKEYVSGGLEASTRKWLSELNDYSQARSNELLSWANGIIAEMEDTGRFPARGYEKDRAMLDYVRKNATFADLKDYGQNVEELSRLDLRKLSRQLLARGGTTRSQQQGASS